MRGKGKPIKTGSYGHFNRDGAIRVSHYYNTEFKDRVAISFIETGGKSEAHTYLTKKQALEFIEKIQEVIKEGSFIHGKEWEE